MDDEPKFMEKMQHNKNLMMKKPMGSGDPSRDRSNALQKAGGNTATALSKGETPNDKRDNGATARERATSENFSGLRVFTPGSEHTDLNSTAKKVDLFNIFSGRIKLYEHTNIIGGSG